MIEPIEKYPRQRDERYLSWLRDQPCCLCGQTPADAAHLRIGSINHDKSYGAMAMKPSDKWALPLCRRHHDEQHGMSESEFWSRYNIDPFALCLHFYARPR